MDKYGIMSGITNERGTSNYAYQDVQLYNFIHRRILMTCPGRETVPSRLKKKNGDQPHHHCTTLRAISVLLTVHYVFLSTAMPSVNCVKLESYGVTLHVQNSLDLDRDN
jgi:hypothetical protein